MQCHENSSIPSLHEVLTKSVQDEIENDPYTLNKFEQFLLKSHCEENYEFWRSCDGYLLKYDNDDFDIQKGNSKIYKKFIRANSPMECNLPEDIKQNFRESYHHGSRVPKDTLCRARQHSWSLMKDAYRQYVRQVCKRSGCCNSRSVSRSESPSEVTRIRSDLSHTSLTIPIIELPTLAVTNTSKPTGASHAFRRSSSFSSSGPETSSSSEESPTEPPDAIGAGTQRLFSKGKEFMSRFRLKNRRTSFASQSSTNSIYTNFERRASDRTLYQK
ncbi:hypothetical protein ZYGR_0H02450 [Zygosaccharomyces rouxii]|uniref:ZYRO0B09658p n=2 Tax=Zygosaccharomyces rouxii TaxID=4956 RepID=C5DRM5_ZYGRC|nr:uncharacterized protein ZYRO0B09658g [Zygosaccharomyces rouxii]KAH9200030.1 RGS domain-containing protein [Zygosaccharomyces rouxii]GAV47403.1 hypothetical protein ZYGR_0H02450 [Zygosaccharomyces rouxii]CAR26436.1 ZYRO0B09658p [Zygosaccharomyces rouxii]